MAKASASSVPGPDAQREAIAEAMKLQMREGQVWYVLCSKWYQLWKAHVRYDVQRAAKSEEILSPPQTALSGETPVGNRCAGTAVDMPKSEIKYGDGANEHGVAELSLGEDAAQVQATAIASSDEDQLRQESLAGPGPIDNRTLGEGRDLRPGMMEDDDYVLMNNRVYELLEAWYGGGPRFKRWVVNLGTNNRTELTVELFPVKFFVYTCLESGEPDLSSKKMQLYSRTKTMRQICADVKSSLHLTPKVDTRLSLKTLEPERGGGAPERNGAVAGGQNGVAADVKMENGTSCMMESSTPASEREYGAAAVFKMQVPVKTANGVPAPKQLNGSGSDLAKAVHGTGTVKLEDDATSAMEGEEDDGGHDGWQEIHLEEVSQSLNQVMGDTQSVALLVETRDVSSPDPKKRVFPRDPRVNRWRYTLKVGDIIDARDTDKKWFESSVTDIAPDGDSSRVKVHFLGWSDKWDQVFDRSSMDLQKLHTFTTPWRQELQVNSRVEICCSRRTDRRWYAGKVEMVKHENGVRMLNVATVDEAEGIGRWVRQDSEEICEMGTHIEDEKPARQRSGSGSYSTGTFYKTNTKGKPNAPGSVGLFNLGNTCFMNSMLQCLLATESLSTYFRNLGWKNEVNHENPLGMGGKVAEAYAGLNDDAWSGEYTVVVPNNVKRVVGQYAPMFAGYQQHDAGELMSFLLDGIHEDLNRVHKKPYMETVDSAGREDAAVADESWRRYLMRNDSIMVDVCTGLLRSHVTCPICHHSSVTFDPYTSLSLPLPVENVIMVKLKYHPLPYGSRPIMMGFTLTKDSTVRDLKTMLCERINGVKTKKNNVDDAPSSSRPLLREDYLALYEEWSSRVFKSIQDTVSVSELKEADDFVICELELPVAGEAIPAGAVVPVPSTPAAGEGSAAYAPPVIGPVSSSQSGQAVTTSGQAAGEAQGEERRAVGVAAVVDKEGGSGRKPSMVVDLVIENLESGISTLVGGPRRITCREGVTNAELHEIIRKHVSRFVPSLQQSKRVPPLSDPTPLGAEAPVPSRVVPDGGSDAMLVDEPDEQTQEPGISSTSDIGSDYVHVTVDTIAVELADSDSGNSGRRDSGSNAAIDDDESSGSPYVHVKKKAATSSNMLSTATASGGVNGGVVAHDSEEETEDGVWNDGTTVASSSDGGITPAGSGLGCRDAVLISPEGSSMTMSQESVVAQESGDADMGPIAMVENGCVSKGVSVEGAGGGGEEVGGGKGKGRAEVLPYVVLATDYAGALGIKATQQEVPVDDEPFRPADTLKTRGRDEDATLKIRFRQECISDVNSEELDAFEQHESLAEAWEQKEKRESIPLDACFQKYTEREQLGQSELWYCSRCKTHRQAHKKLDVYTAPDVLIIVLKRFFTTGNSLLYRQKLDNHVSFPINGLDLTSNIRSVGGPIFEDAPPVYDLYAVSEHSGSLRGGHYTAMTMNPENKKWYKFNDSMVSETNPDRGPSSLPYVLFYKRRKGVLRWAGMGQEHEQ